MARKTRAEIELALLAGALRPSITCAYRGQQTGVELSRDTVCKIGRYVSAQVLVARFSSAILVRAASTSRRSVISLRFKGTQ